MNTAMKGMKGLKSGSRIAAIASGPIGRNRSKTLIVCIIGREGSIIEGVLSSTIKINGADSTNKICGMISRSRFKEQIKIVCVNGVAMAGLNVIDVKAIGRRTGANTLIITRRKPNRTKLVHAIRTFGKKENVPIKPRENILKQQAGKVERVDGFYVENGNLVPKRIITTSIEMLRLAHIIARGVSTGESKGRM